MHIKKKINLKIYFGLSIAQLGLTYFVVKNLQEYFVILLVFIATVINQWLLVDSVEKLVANAAGHGTDKKNGAVFKFLLKTFLIIAALSFGVHIMEKRIIIPLLNYIIQIFILYFSFRQKD